MLSYYSRHRSERIAYSKRYREDNREKCLASSKRYYEENRAKRLASTKRWGMNNLDKIRAIKYAQNHFSLGGCCEFCGSTVGLRRFLVEDKVPVDFVVTVCYSCGRFACDSLVMRSEGDE